MKELKWLADRDMSNLGLHQTLNVVYALKDI